MWVCYNYFNNLCSLFMIVINFFMYILTIVYIVLNHCVFSLITVLRDGHSFLFPCIIYKLSLYVSYGCRHMHNTMEICVLDLNKSLLKCRHLTNELKMIKQVDFLCEFYFSKTTINCCCLLVNIVISFHCGMYLVLVFCSLLSWIAGHMSNVLGIFILKCNVYRVQYIVINLHNYNPRKQSLNLSVSNKSGIETRLT